MALAGCLIRVSDGVWSGSLLGCSREATMTVEKSRPELRVADFESADREPLNALSFRTRVAVLWVAVALAVSGSMLLGLFMPGALEELLAGEIEGETLDDALGFLLAGMLIMPIVMAAVTLLVGDRVNHYVNLVAGMALGLFGVYAAVRETSADGFNVHILMIVVASLLALLIAALGLIGLRQSTDRPSLRT